MHKYNAHVKNPSKKNLDSSAPAELVCSKHWSLMFSPLFKHLQYAVKAETCPREVLSPFISALNKLKR